MYRHTHNYCIPELNPHSVNISMRPAIQVTMFAILRSFSIFLTNTTIYICTKRVTINVFNNSKKIFSDFIENKNVRHCQMRLLFLLQLLNVSTFHETGA
jgi:hypothetical protein